jgi:hypothetical protein
MRKLPAAIVVALSAAPLFLNADVTIRYKTEIASPLTPAANTGNSQVIHMKGMKGATIYGSQTTIIDFGRQEVTLLDTARKTFATIPASEYSARLSANITSAMPTGDGVAEILKSMKVTCDSKSSGRTETIQGIRAEEREVACSLKMSVPESVKAIMPDMGTKIVMRLWSASAAERVRVPGLWQLSGFELWQQHFMNPTEAFGKMSPDGMATLMESIQKDQSALLRSSMEMSMNFPMPGAANSATETPFMKMTSEVVELSMSPLDDSLFVVPADYASEPFADVMNGVTAAAMKAAKADAAASTSAAAPIPENVKAYVPFLMPVNETEPGRVADANGQRVQGMVRFLVTVGPQGNVEQAEVLTGPELLRKPATDAIRHWTFRPVIRNGTAVSAYTTAFMDFTDYSKGPPAAAAGFTADMMAGQQRMSQLETTFPRSPAQELADLEQDTGGADPMRRSERLDELALLAAKIGDSAKAKTYATDLLAAAQRDKGGWNYGNAIHDGHVVLGLVALHNDDILTADRELLEAGKTTGSPQMNSFGPNMTLAQELLNKGERNTVLDYFELCRKFWKSGATRLDSWSDAVRNGGTPSLVGLLP